MEIRESAEMYLETILVLSKRGEVRSIDIAREMDFSRASVSVTVHALEDKNYIKIDEKGRITLLPKGIAIASEIYDRHVVLSGFLISIGVEEELANRDACKMEHAISHKTFEALKSYIEKNKGKKKAK